MSGEGLFGELPASRTEDGGDAYTRALVFMGRLRSLLEVEAPLTLSLVGPDIEEHLTMLATWRIQLEDYARDEWERIQREHGDDLVVEVAGYLRGAAPEAGP